MLLELVKKNRSYRKFVEEYKVDNEVLYGLIELARLTPSGFNLQHLKFMLINCAEQKGLVFPCLGWAGYLKDWNGPEEGERPSAYIIVLGDLSIRKEIKYDPGIVCQTILLGAVEKGLGGCIINNVNREQLREKLHIDDNYEILPVIALGKPNEEIIIESLGADGNVKYWRDNEGRLHVPKRSLTELIVKP